MPLGKVTIAGIDATIGTEAECEAADYVVCCTADMFSPFADNITASCCACGTAIIHRPYAPKRPPKICMECMGGLAGGLQ